ncbi:T9SS type A sorting domain-containing protein [Yeosuana sp. AK3]
MVSKKVSKSGDLSTFKPGVYFLNITSNGSRLSKKLILNY